MKRNSIRIAWLASERCYEKRTSSLTQREFTIVTSKEWPLTTQPYTVLRCVLFVDCTMNTSMVCYLLINLTTSYLVVLFWVVYCFRKAVKPIHFVLLKTCIFLFLITFHSHLRIVEISVVMLLLCKISVVIRTFSIV